MDENALSRVIIGAAIEVHKELGPGLLESIYESALCLELADAGIPCARQVDVPVVYKGRALDGHLRLDLLVSNAVIVEVKSVENLVHVHEAQLLSYLRIADKRLGLVMNFNSRVLRSSIRRVVNGL
jgi:GxxExxY protein